MLRKILSVSLLMVLTAALLPSDAEAQRRPVVRRSSGGRVVYVRPYYPVYYSPFYAGWYGGWYGGGLYGWGAPYSPYGFYGQYYPPYRYRYDNAGSARIEVKPREAEVYVDGYLVGTVDDFDGWLQRLHVAPGEHVVEIYLPGHRTIREQVLFRPGATVKISGALEPLPQGSADEGRPVPPPDTGARTRGAYPPDPRRGYPPAPRTRRDDPRAPRGDQAPGESFGSVTIRAQPGDAEVTIDGDRWETPPPGEPLVVELSEGEHRVEIRRSGFRSYTNTIRVRRGETTPLNVSLTRQED